jgi:hypothetical protein
LMGEIAGKKKPLIEWPKGNFIESVAETDVNVAGGIAAHLSGIGPRGFDTPGPFRMLAIMSEPTLSGKSTLTMQAIDFGMACHCP